MYGIPVLHRSLGLEVPLTKTQGNAFKFPDDKTIRADTVYVNAIEAFTIVQITLTPGGLTPILAAGALGLTITLQDDKLGGSSDKVKDSPYYDFITSLNTGYPREIKPFRINLTNSYVKVVDPTSITTGEAAYFTIWYFYLNDISREEAMAYNLLDEWNKRSKR